MRTYQYRCNDYSLLTPAFKKWVITPLIRFVPWAIPANIITLISNLFIYIGLYLAIHPHAVGQYTPACVALCLLTYLIGDHLDGMQAKRTGTGSALGEFCDHYLDAFNNGIVVYTMCFFFQVTQPMIIAGVIAVSYLAHMAVFYEQFKTGWLRFEPVGSLEGVLMAAALIGLSSSDAFYAAITTELWPNLSVATLIILASAGGALLTFIQTYRRTPDVKYGYWLFALLLIGVSVLCVLVFSSFQSFVMLTLYASLYVGKVMYAHLIDGHETQPDWIMPALLLSYFVLGFSNAENTFWILTVYLALRILILIVRTFSTLRLYWVWQNSRL